MIVVRTADGKRHLYDNDADAYFPGAPTFRQRMFPEIVYHFDQTFGAPVMSAAQDGSDPFWTRPDDMDAKIEALLRYRVEKERLERVVAALPELQARCARWRTAPDKASWVPPTSINQAFKTGEETGEFMRAVLGVEEHREDRGDPIQEAAQIVFVLLCWFGIHHPDSDLLTEVLNEMERCGA
jgi:hypothetical protein